MSTRVELRRDAGRVGPDTGPWIRRRQVTKVWGPADPSALAQLVDTRFDDHYPSMILLRREIAALVRDPSNTKGADAVQLVA